MRKFRNVGARCVAWSILLSLLLVSLTRPTITRALVPPGQRAQPQPVTAIVAPVAESSQEQAPEPQPDSNDIANDLADNENVILPGQIDRDRTRRDHAPGILAHLDADPDVALMVAAGEERVRVLVDLQMPSLARAGREMTPDARTAYAAEVARAQDAVIREIEAQGGELLGRLTTLSSGIIVAMPGFLAPTVAALPQVARLTLIHDYALDLSETVPELGADLVHTLGLTGEGVVVAVLDSGIDYTHKAFGGPGTVAAFEEAYYGDDPGCSLGTENVCAHSQPPINPSIFGPTAPKVIGGFDWLGEQWPNVNAIMPDSNPIDIQGHGTHVADIIAGLGYDAGSNGDGPYGAKGVGVAPGAKLWALRVCAAASSSCNGASIALALDDAADMDNEPDTVDPVDIANLSLGSAYGQPEDDSIALINELAALGVIVVVSAGNAGDPPYIVGQPSIADGALSVAQTTVPSFGRYPLAVLEPPSIAGNLTSGIWQAWSVNPKSAAPGSEVVSGALIYGDGDGTNTLGCSDFDTNLTGLVVLVDRGACDFTQKARNASVAGATMALIGMADETLPFDSSDGQHRPISMTVFMISKAEADLLRVGLGEAQTVVQLDPAAFVALPKTVVDTSARGPRINDSVIKPDIAAPGASISAVAGSGALNAPFGGTSGAAPMVAGVAALLKEQYGATLDLHEYRALLMNNANPAIHLVNPLLGTLGDLAEIARIGSGQVDAAASQAALLLAWDSTGADPVRWTGALSFGYAAASANRTLTRTLTVKNLHVAPVEADLTATFRYANDQNLGVQITLPPNPITIPANGTTDVDIVLELFPAMLRPWATDKGEFGGDSVRFREQEVDGFILITPTVGAAIHVPWHVLPKAAAALVTTTVPSAGGFSGGGSLTNQSALVGGKVESFDLVEQNDHNYNFTVGDCSTLDLAPGCNLTAIDLKDVGVRTVISDTGSGDELFLEFALTLWDAPYRAAALPVEFDIYIDSDRDGEDDYVVFNADLTFEADGFDGRNVVWVVDLLTQARTPYVGFLSDFNTQNSILRIPAAAVDVAQGEQFGFAVSVFDSYFSGQRWDCSPAFENFCLDYHIYTAGQPAFAIPTSQRSFAVAPGAAANYNYSWSLAGASASPAQIGLLFMYESAPVGREHDAVPLSQPAGKLAASIEASAASAQVGESISYLVRISNTGTLTVTDVQARDDLLGPLTLGTTTLGPGAATTANVTYKVLQIDYPGPLVNVVDASATPLLGNPLAASASTTVTVMLPPTGLAVNTQANVSSILVGEGFIYSYVITNTGALTLTNITASDDKAGLLPLPVTTLAPGAAMTTSTSYAPLLADLPGPLVNRVEVNGTPPIGNLVQASASTTVTLSQPEIGMVVTKRPSAPAVNVGAPLSYFYEITNIGALTLTNVMATDDKLGALPLGKSAVATSLASGASLEVVLPYVVQRSDLPGPLVNVVTATATPLIGTELGAEVVVTASAAVSLTDGDLLFVKSVGIDTIQPPCSTQVYRVLPISTTVVYCYTVENVGQQTMTHHSLVDSDLGTILDEAAQVVPPGGFYSVTVTKTVTVSVTNVATWTASLDPTSIISGMISGAMISGADAGQMPAVESRVIAAVRISGPTEDQDEDSIPDNTEGAQDVDKDNVPNFLDTDSDGDGMLDVDEVGPDPARPRDSNGDGIPDYLTYNDRIFMPRLRRAQ